MRPGAVVLTVSFGGWWLSVVFVPGVAAIGGMPESAERLPPEAEGLLSSGPHRPT
jgi:hypothetical protein